MDFKFYEKEKLKDQIELKEEKHKMYGIKITYSWGDEEELYGNYETEEEA